MKLCNTGSFRANFVLCLSASLEAELITWTYMQLPAFCRLFATANQLSAVRRVSNPLHCWLQNASLLQETYCLFWPFPPFVFGSCTVTSETKKADCFCSHTLKHRWYTTQMTLVLSYKEKQQVSHVHHAQLNYLLQMECIPGYTLPWGMNTPDTSFFPSQKCSTSIWS